MATFRVMTPGRRRVLRQLVEGGPLSDRERSLMGVRRSTLDELIEMGLVEYRAEQDHWALTEAGEKEAE